MVWVDGLVKVGFMACKTFGRSAGITIFMTIQAIDSNMSAGKRENGSIVIESAVGLSSGMALIASDALVDIPPHSLMLPVGINLVVFMAINATEQTIISRCGMAFCADFPFVVMISAVNREVLPVVIEGRWRPCCRCMAKLAFRRKLSRFMRRVGGLAVSLQMAAYAGIRGVVIIPVMAFGAVVGNGVVRAFQNVVVVVNIKGCRFPSGLCGVA